MQAFETTHQDEKRSVAAAALIMAGGTMVSRVLGFVRDMVLYAYFSRTVTDAYLAAFRIPNLFRRLLGEGSLSISFIPVFIDLLKKGHTDKVPSEAKLLVNGMFTLLITFLTVLTAVGVIFAENIVYLLVSGRGFMAIPGKFELTVKMTRIMFGFIFFISLYAYFMAILNSLKRFAVAAFAPTMFNIVLVIAALLPTPAGTFDGFFLALGVLVGGFLEMAILIPSLIKVGYLPRLTVSIGSPHIRRIFKTMLPSWIGVGILQITGLINVRFASELGEGTISYIYLADRILELPLSLFAVSLGSALLPTLSRLWSQDSRREMIETSAHYLKMVYFLAIPAAVGVYALAGPIIEILFERGQFDALDTQSTTPILQVYAFAILTYAGVRVIVAPFYAIKNTWLPAACSGFSLVFHVIFAYHLIKPFGAVGLTAATVLSSGMNLTLLTFFHQRLIGPLPLGRFFWAALKFSVAAAGMLGVTMLYPHLTRALEPLAVAKIIALMAVITLSGLTYFGLAHLLRVEEAQATWRALSGRALKRFRPKV